MLFNKKKTVALFFFIIFLQNPLKCMFSKINILRSLPLIAAFIKRTFFKNPSTVFAGHIIYNTDGSEVTEHQFNDIKDTILRPNEFPTALKNPNYNPDANETKEIKEKLDFKYNQNFLTPYFVDPFSECPLIESTKKTTVQWIPQTLHDLFTYTYSNNEHDEYIVNQKIHDHLTKNHKKSSESDTTYYQRLAEPFIESTSNNILHLRSIPFFRWEIKEREEMKEAVLTTIAIEVDHHEKDQSEVLLYRGQGAENDFYPKDGYEVGKQEHNARYCKKMTKNAFFGIPITISYGLSLLSNAKPNNGACPFSYAFQPNKVNQDLQLLPILKKEFMNKKSLWYINPDYDYHKSVHAKGVYFHPRAKGHATEHIIKTKSGFHSDYFKRQDRRFILYETKDEAFNAYKKLKEYQIHNAIGVTEYTKNMINKAQDAYAKGQSDRN